MLYLLFHPGADCEERIPFSVSEANIDDALDYGRAERDMTFDEQIDATAYHMVLELNVSSEPWVIVRDGRIVGRNPLSMSVREDDLSN